MSGRSLIINSLDVAGEAIPVVIKNIEGVVVNVGASVEIANEVGNPIPVTGPATDAQLRATALPVSGPATDAQLRATALAVAVASSASRAQATITRPANQTPYTAGDVVGGAITFPSMGVAGSQQMLTSVDLRIDIAAVPSGMTSFRLYLYSVTPPSALADNAVWDLPSGDRAGFIGYVDLGSPVDLGSTLFVQLDAINKHVKLGAAETALYGYLVTATAFTPAANSEVYVPTLRAVAL